MNPKPFGSPRIITACILAICALVFTPNLPAQADAPAAGETYRAESFTLGYGAETESIIPLDALRSLKVNIELRDGVYYPSTGPVAAAPCAVGQTFPDGKFSEAALLEIFQSIAKYYNTRGIYGVFVVVNRDDIDPQTREDYRPANRKDLRLTIWVSRVSEMRTIAKGSRIPATGAINNPAHKLILKHSPLQPDPNTTKPNSALWKKRLDNYLLDLNRHPARRVDAAISAGASAGEVTLDYLVSETRPWFAYAQLSDSGTDETDDLRAHLGFSYYQLTNHDDTLLLDLSSTTDIESGFSASASYNRPLLYPNTLRAKVYGAYSEFTARDLGIALDKFTGYSIATGAELPWSPFRIPGGISFDIIPGVTWQKYHTYDSNQKDVLPLRGKSTTDFITASLSLHFERNTDAMRTYFRIKYETNFDGDTGLTANQLIALGRYETTRDYQVLSYDLGHTMFIEPLLFGEKFYSGDNWRKSARAHEISFSSRGQYSITDDRLIPQKMMTLGGMYSVRGYPESTTSGDNVYAASLEYRLHVPRLFRPYAALPRDRGDHTPPTYFGIPMNWRSPNLHALPDWDFIVRLFGDVGRSHVIPTSKAYVIEESHTLASVGFGFEAQFKGTFNARIDWGFAQKSVHTTARDVSRNSSQVHFTISVLW